MAVPKIADITITQQTGTEITLLTAGNYVEQNVYFDVDVQQASVQAGQGSADVDAVSSASTGNIYSSIGAKTSVEPVSGYFIEMAATGSGKSHVNTAGWVDSGDLAEASATTTQYFPIDTASVILNTPSIDPATGEVTASARVNSAGYIAAAPISSVLQLSVLSQNDVSVLGPTVTIPAGYYVTSSLPVSVQIGSVQPSVVSHNVTEPTISIATSGSINSIATAQKPEGSDRENYWTITPSVTTTNGSSSVTAGATVTPGYVSSSSVTPDSDTKQIVLTPSVGSDLYIEKGSTVIDPITVSEGGEITATATVTAGFQNATTSSNKPSKTHQLTPMAGATITPTESVQTAVEKGRYTTGIVQVGAIPSTYVGSQITPRTSNDLTASGPTVTVPEGYYASEGTKSVDSGSITLVASEYGTRTNPAVTTSITGSAVNDNILSDSPGTGSDGTDYWTITPSGTSNSAGSCSIKASTASFTAGYIATAPTEATSSITNISASVVPGSSKYIRKGTTTVNTPSVDANGLITASVVVSDGYQAASTPSNTRQLDTKSEDTYNVSTSDRTIASGTYITGTQTIKGVEVRNISEGNIKYGVTVTVGDENRLSRITSKTGTFTATPSGRNALVSEALLPGYTGFINGDRVDGNMASSVPNPGTTTVENSQLVRGTWSQTAGYTIAREIDAATFSNTATNGKNYFDISNYDDAPVLATNDYLYINSGYTDDLKISLAKLVPNGSDIAGHADYLLYNHRAYDNAGLLVTGDIQTLDEDDLSFSGASLTIPLHKYTGANDATAIKKTMTSGTYAAAVVDAEVTQPEYTPSISGSITDIAITTLPTGSDRTNFWTITPGGTSVDGTAKSKAKATITKSGYLAKTTTGKTTDYKSLSVVIDVKPSTTYYIPKASVSASVVGQGSATIKPSTVTISKQTTGGSYVDASDGAETTSPVTGHVYVCARASAQNSAETVSISRKSGSISVDSAGYLPSNAKFSNITLTGNVTLTPDQDPATSSLYYIPIKTTSASKAGNTVSWESGWISKDSLSIDGGKITSASATISSVSVTAGSDATKFSVSGSASIGNPEVTIPGYISSNPQIGTLVGNTANLSATINKIVGTASINDTLLKPTLSKVAITSTYTDASNGAETKAPVAGGVYVAVKSNQNKTSITPSINISVAGYGTNSKHGIAGSGAYVGAAASDTYYIPIKTATPSFKGGAITGTATATSSNATLSSSTNNSGIIIDTAGSATRAVVQYNSAVEGWVSKAANADAYSSDSNTFTGSSYYLNGVTMTTGSSNRTFNVNAPDNASNHNYLFTADTSGKTSIKVDTTLTMQWNAADECLDFIYT